MREVKDVNGYCYASICGYWCDDTDSNMVLSGAPARPTVWVLDTELRFFLATVDHHIRIQEEIEAQDEV